MTEAEKTLEGIKMTNSIFNLFEKLNLSQAMDLADQIIVSTFGALMEHKGVDPDDKETMARAARLFSDHILNKLIDFSEIEWEDPFDAD